MADLHYLAIEKRGNVWWVIYGQTSNGVPVEGRARRLPATPPTASWSISDWT